MQKQIEGAAIGSQDHVGKSKRGYKDLTTPYIDLVEDMQTGLEVQQLLTGFQQDGYSVNTDLVYKDWQVELDRFG